MHDLTSSGSTPQAEPPVSLRQHLLRTALLVVVLGVLPFAWDAEPVWQVLGALVALVMLLRSLQLVWRACFSTRPRHLHGH